MKNVLVSYINSLRVLVTCLAMVGICSSMVMAAEAAEEKPNRANLYFYTVDGEEIEVLYRRINTKKDYVFSDPDLYKYLPYEDNNGQIIYHENNDLIQGLYWEEITEDGRSYQYYSGDSVNFSAGDHYIYVKSDRPDLTGENMLTMPKREYVYLYFYNANGDEIFSLYKEFTSKDQFTFPTPADYTYWYEEDIDTGYMSEPSDITNLEGIGIYWWCEDDNGKQYLFQNGDTCNFRPGTYEFHIRTDDPVNVTFYYPDDVPTYFVTSNAPGEVYARFSARVGDTITLKKSLGAILWECSFQGWEERNSSYASDHTFAGGSSYRIMNNQDLAFFAMYEFDVDWDSNEIDQNEPDEELNTEEDIFVNVEAVNEAAGAGYDAFIDEDGMLQHTGGKAKINSEVGLYGIPGKIKKQSSFTSLAAADADPNDPQNYHLDKYGRKMEDSNLPMEINNVLRQDDSAMYMDVYGNSFVYYSQLSREANKELALERLTAGKTASWSKNVQHWDTEMVNRFEAIEFALLHGTYPEEDEELVSGVVWKNSYMSKKAFDQLKNYKKMWSGWLDVYDDGLLEKYKEQSSSGITIVDKLRNLFELTVYAAEKEDNGKGIANQIGARINTSNDLNNVEIKPQYYKEDQIYGFSSYAFSGLSGLTNEQIQNLTQVFNALVNYGYSEEMAAGACGNIWQESHFNPVLESASGYIGIVQWGGGRAASLKSYAASKGKEWTNLTIQIEFLIKELDASYASSMNRYLRNYSAYGDAKSVKDVQTACEAFCVAVEGCICVNSGVTHKHHNEKCKIAGNGKSYQHLVTRIAYSHQVYNAMTNAAGFIGGDFAGMENKEIISQIFPGATSMNNMTAAGYTQKVIERDYIISVRTPGGKTVRVNKYIADDILAALSELEATGFPLNSISGYVYRHIANSGSLSFHSSGLAIDINPKENPVLTFKNYVGDEGRVLRNLELGLTDLGGNYAPKTDPAALRVVHANIFRAYYWLWGRDFRTKADMMHFSLGEVTHDGCNAFISNYFEQ